MVHSNAMSHMSPYKLAHFGNSEMQSENSDDPICRPLNPHLSPIGLYEFASN